jgi:hypothetical protein
MWRQIDDARFEGLALAHVRELYPDFDWHSTSLTEDGGKDAVGELRNVTQGISETYWMEAKHHPAKRSIGKYTLDTHLLSTFLSRNVKRLHIVTSGLLSSSFIIRADKFSKEHGFAFAYTDQEALSAWLYSRLDIARDYFGQATADYVSKMNIAPIGSGSILSCVHGCG